MSATGPAADSIGLVDPCHFAPTAEAENWIELLPRFEIWPMKGRCAGLNIGEDHIAHEAVASLAGRPRSRAVELLARARVQVPAEPKGAST